MARSGSCPPRPSLLRATPCRRGLLRRRPASPPAGAEEAERDGCQFRSWLGLEISWAVDAERGSRAVEAARLGRESEALEENDGCSVLHVSPNVQGRKKVRLYKKKISGKHLSSQAFKRKSPKSNREKNCIEKSQEQRWYTET